MEFNKQESVSNDNRMTTESPRHCGRSAVCKRDISHLEKLL